MCVTKAAESVSEPAPLTSAANTSFLAKRNAQRHEGDGGEGDSSIGVAGVAWHERNQSQHALINGRPREHRRANRSRHAAPLGCSHRVAGISVR
jgi:hypothetical protein